MSNIHKLVESYLHKPFEWGTNDCLMFSGSIAQEISGITIIDDIKHKYKTPKEAIKLMGEYGLENLHDIFGLFFKEIRPQQAMRGDVVLASHTGLWKEVLGIVGGDYAYTTGEKGLIKIPMNSWIKAWRVK